MGQTPTIKTTKTGKRYFVVNGRKVFITKKMTNKEISSIYRLLKKRTSLFKTNPNNSNKISIKIDNSARTQTQKARFRNRSKKNSKSNFVSTIDPANRVTTTSGVNALDQDLLNSSINKTNKSLHDSNKLLTMIQDEKNKPPNEDERRRLLRKDINFFIAAYNASRPQQEPQQEPQQKLQIVREEPAINLDEEDKKHQGPREPEDIPPDILQPPPVNPPDILQPPPVNPPDILQPPPVKLSEEKSPVKPDKPRVRIHRKSYSPEEKKEKKQN